MKKFVCFMSCICLILCSTACMKEKTKSESTSTTSISSESADNGSNLSAELKSEDFPLPKYDKKPIYENVEIDSSTASGIFGVYEETMSNRSLEKDSYNLYKIQINKILKMDETKKIKGYDLYNLENRVTFYKARITYDYLRNKEMDKEIYITHYGNNNIQKENKPPYQVGDVVASYIYYNKSSDYYCFAINFQFDLYESNNEQIGYYRWYPYDALKPFELELFDDEKKIVTTTVNNPVIYSAKYKMSDIADFLRKDWVERGLITLSDNRLPMEIYLDLNDKNNSADSNVSEDSNLEDDNSTEIKNNVEDDLISKND